MKTTNIFEVAVRNKYRYPFNGYISTEDLWDLTVQQLDEIFKSLKAAEREANEESLLDTCTEADVQRSHKIAIIRHIVDVKLTEAEEKANEKKASEERQKIMAIIADKQNEDLRSKSIEELLAMLEDKKS